jgi:hypothetical protein
VHAAVASSRLRLCPGIPFRAGRPSPSTPRAAQTLYDELRAKYRRPSRPSGLTLVDSVAVKQSKQSWWGRGGGGGGKVPPGGAGTAESCTEARRAALERPHTPLSAPHPHAHPCWSPAPPNRLTGLSTLLQSSSGLAPQPGLPAPAVQGLYMYGGVGCGKTMLMDLFVKAAPPEFQVGGRGRRGLGAGGGFPALSGRGLAAEQR